MRHRRGSVLIHVLITGLVVAVIAAGVLRMTLQNYAASSRAAMADAARVTADSGLNAMTGAWNAANAVCADGNGYDCTGAAGTCGCTCTRAGWPTVVAAVSGTRCQITVTSAYTPQ